MKNLLFSLLFAAMAWVSCSDKKEEEKNKFISIRSVINGEIANVDTSLFSIMRLDIIDSAHTDTSHIKREDFRKVAQEFLDIPDISEKKMSKNYKEESLYDETLNKVILTYLPLKPEEAQVQRQDVTVTPSLSGGNSEIKSIFISYLQNSKDSAVEKKMLWQVNRSFQITTIRQKPGSPETISTLKVTWNEPEF
jgi:hypothetical protein